MTKITKALALTLCAVLLIAGSIMGTLAYLTDEETVENTFTIGNVAITMNEADADEYGVVADATVRVTENDYKLVPGRTYKKDVVIHVNENSEECYLFVKIDETFTAIDSGLTLENGWTALPGVDGVYYYETTVTEKQNIKVLDSFTVNTDATANSLAAFNTAEATIKAYAIQTATNFQNAAAAWEASGFVA